MNIFYGQAKKTVFLLSVFLMFAAVSLHAQDVDAHSPKAVPSTGKQREAEKKKIDREKKQAKALEEGRKRHMSFQEKQTKKMMKKSKKSSKRWNENKREPFLKRLFRKDHR